MQGSSLSADEKFHVLMSKNAELLKKKLNGREDEFILPKMLLGKLTKPKNSKGKNIWQREFPVYVADAARKFEIHRISGSYAVHRDLFPKRRRGEFCYLCGVCNGAELTKCSVSGCPTRFHLSCARNSTLGGYTHKFMQRRSERPGLMCSRHHCTACFSDLNRSRCFAGSFLITCNQCELAWHRDCIPCGCSIDSKNEITCPRHVAFPDHPTYHLQHCAYCQQKPESTAELIKCTNCFRSAHLKCYNESELRQSEPADVQDEQRPVICHWCEMFDFVRYGDYAMGRFSRQWWYPCQTVSNDEFPEKNNPLLGSVGYLCVKWLPYKGKIFYNLLSHNRIIVMTDRDYFFVNEAHTSDIFDEWKEAQKCMIQNSSQNRPLKQDQIPDKAMSNGHRMIKQIQRNQYFKMELRTQNDRLLVPDFCNCPNGPDRCGPSTNCINRTLLQECPKGCGEDFKLGCANRRLSEGNNCIKVEIKYFPGKGYGAVALEEVPANGFVGEYVGEVISNEEGLLRVERIADLQSHEAQYYIMKLDERRSIDAQFYGNDMRFVNHSCSPNCMIQQIQSGFDVHLVLVAKKDISVGEELSFDYNMQADGRLVPKCHCGAPNCTGVLSADKSANLKMDDWKGKENEGTINTKTAHRTASLPVRKLKTHTETKWET
uniref:Histone-lysine N-methyltransferase n=1 Tax=Globodera rostochiensis TaxID=31243 RepID=A0A914GXP3_GLORO